MVFLQGYNSVLWLSLAAHIYKSHGVFDLLPAVECSKSNRFLTHVHLEVDGKPLPQTLLYRRVIAVFSPTSHRGRTHQSPIQTD